MGGGGDSRVVRKGLCEEVTFGLTPEFQEDVIPMELGSRARLEQVPRPHSGAAAVCAGGRGAGVQEGKGPSQWRAERAVGPQNSSSCSLSLAITACV